MALYQQIWNLRHCLHLVLIEKFQWFISVLSDEIYNSEGEQKGLSDKDIWFDRVLPKMKEAFLGLLIVFTEEK